MQVKGSLTISRDGVLADGLVASSIEPERVLDGGADFQAFIPFHEGAGEAFASVKGKVAVPVAKFSADAGAQIGQAGYELRGRLATPFTGREVAGKTAGKIDSAGCRRGGQTVRGAGGCNVGRHRTTGRRSGRRHGQRRQAAARSERPGHCRGDEIRHARR